MGDSICEQHVNPLAAFHNKHYLNKAASGYQGAEKRYRVPEVKNTNQRRDNQPKKQENSLKRPNNDHGQNRDQGNKQRHENQSKNQDNSWKRPNNDHDKNRDQGTIQRRDNQPKKQDNSWKRPNNDFDSHKNQKWNHSEIRPNYNRNRDNQQQQDNYEPGTSSHQNLAKVARSDVYKWWNQLAKRLLQLKNKLELSSDEHSLWHDTWKAAAGGAVGPVRALPVAYLQLPATASLAPQTSTVLAVLFQVCEHVKDHLQKATRSKEDFPTINTLEAVLDTVKLRLCNQVQANTLSGGMAALLKAADQLETSLFTTIAQSIGQSKIDREIDRLARLLGRRSDLKDLTKRIKAAASGPMGMSHESPDTDGLEWLGWQKRPTLGWLMSGAWHRTEGLKAIYVSEKEYAETLLRVWSLLTFYWGSGSVWPRCQHRQPGHVEGNACGEPLLAGGGGSEARCRRRNCGGVAVWRCYRQSFVLPSILNRTIDHLGDIQTYMPKHGHR